MAPAFMELKQVTVRRVAESARVLAELEGHSVITDMREELEQQKEQVSKLASGQVALVQRVVQEAGGQEGRRAGERGRSLP